MLKTNNLNVGYGKKIILSDINLSVEPGKIISLIGPNGSGKSTVLKTFTKQILALNGSVCVCDKNLNSLKEIEVAKHISMVSTERIFPERMSCKEVIATGRYSYTGKLGFLSEEDWSYVDKAIKTVHAEDVADKNFLEISDGQRQRVMLARAICQNTEIIILDEPTSYLDMFYKLDLLKTIYKLAKEENKSIIMTLHELDLVRIISDVVVCVDGKRVLKAGSVSEIFSGSFIQDLYGVNSDEFDVSSGMMHLKLENVQGNGTPAKLPTAVYEEGERKRSVELPTRSEAERCTRKKAKVIMVQGTMSNAGKSFLVAGLCRIFKQDGFRVAPFKSQNMALNSFITKEGLEMGRAQVMQAEAAGIEPRVCMNPILLKPTTEKGSQVIVNGEVLGNMAARDYFKFKPQLIPHIKKAFSELEEIADIIVIEGAGSPAEINLRENDIVNMGLAEILDAPVLLVADIDRGGVFAQLLGTVDLLQKEERDRIKGLVINKFRGDKSLLDSGIDMLEKRSGIPVTGVLPYLKINLEDEDSLSTRFEKQSLGLINIGVIKLPKISNFSDFSVFEQYEEVSVHYISNVSEIERMDFLIIPGSKNTIEDLKYLRESGFETAIKRFAEEKVVFGICGGYQVLGNKISDPDNVECGGEIRGMELLDVETVLLKNKTRTQIKTDAGNVSGWLSFISGKNISGYEIHMGKTSVGSGAVEMAKGAFCKNVYGSYIHGFFDEGDIAFCLIEKIAKDKGINISGNCFDYKAFKETQYNLLADSIRKNMNMEEVYKMLK